MTERAYETDWLDFNAFAARIGRGHERHERPAVPETVALYVADLARRGPRCRDDRAPAHRESRSIIAPPS